MYTLVPINGCWTRFALLLDTQSRLAMSPAGAVSLRQGSLMAYHLRVLQGRPQWEVTCGVASDPICLGAVRVLGDTAGSLRIGQWANWTPRVKPAPRRRAPWIGNVAFRNHVHDIAVHLRDRIEQH